MKRNKQIDMMLDTSNIFTYSLVVERLYLVGKARFGLTKRY